MMGMLIVSYIVGALGMGVGLAGIVLGMMKRDVWFCIISAGALVLWWKFYMKPIMFGHGHLMANIRNQRELMKETL